MTRILSTPSDLGRKGSRKIRWGFKITSESSPGACPVEDPSKFHLGSLSTEEARSTVRVRVLDLQFPTASIHTYSANTLSEGNASASYLAMTAGSREDFPVCFDKTTLSLVVGRLIICPGSTLNAATHDRMEKINSDAISYNFILFTKVDGLLALCCAF